MKQVEGGKVPSFHAGSFETKRPTRQERSALSFAFARVPFMRCDARLDGGGGRKGGEGEARVLWATAQGLNWWPQDGEATSNSNQRQEKLNLPLAPPLPLEANDGGDAATRRPHQWLPRVASTSCHLPVASTSRLHQPPILPITTYLPPPSVASYNYISPISTYTSPPLVATHQPPLIHRHATLASAATYQLPPLIAIYLLPRAPSLICPAARLTWGSGRVYLHLFSCA